MQPTQLDDLFARFVRERKYLQNVRPSTIEWYSLSWRSFKSSATPGLTTPDDLTLDQLQQFVYAMRDRGVRPVTCNNRLRALNAFFRWMHERGDLQQRVHIRPLKVEKRLLQTLDDDAIGSVVGFKPPSWVTLNKKHRDGPRKGEKAFALWRVHALVCGLLDTGCRVQELLDARVHDFDVDDLLLTVIGKGDKQRRIPFSIELRRILYRYGEHRQQLGVRSSELLMFPEHSGGPWDQRNALRSFYVFQRRLGLQRVGFHRLRHTFATEYLRRGGDVVRLSRTLGHTQITTTMRYVHLLTDDLSIEHATVSILTGRRT